jgi:hypothetical protein
MVAVQDPCGRTSLDNHHRDVAIVLFVANGNGNQPFNGARAVAGLAALTLVIPFLCYVCALLRNAAQSTAWLANSALAAGLAWITLKIGSGVPLLAIQRGHVADGTALHSALGDLADGATSLSLYPLAIFCAATAIVALRTRALPRWLGVGAAITAAALAVNAGFLETSSVPAMLLFVLWTLLTGVRLFRINWRRPTTSPARVSST